MRIRWGDVAWFDTSPLAVPDKALHPPSMRLALIAGVVAAAVFASGEAASHKLPSFPQVRLIQAEPDLIDPLVWRLTVQVLDPAGQRTVSRAKVTVRARHTELGSAIRTDEAWLAPRRDSGIYVGEIRFPRAGRWELTIDVVGRYVGDAHFPLEAVTPQRSQQTLQVDKPQLDIDLPTLRHLAMEWGHLMGFGLWLVATGVGLLNPTDRRPFVLIATWAAFLVEGVTGLYKMEYSTPFAEGLQLFNLTRVPRVFFAREYVYTLVVKHALMLVAMGVTLVLTLHVWRTKPGEGVRAYRGMLGMNLVIALAIAAAAAVLGLYHAIVLHFS